MNNRVNGSNRHNGAVTLIAEIKTPRHNPPPKPQEDPNSSAPAPEVAEKPQTDAGSAKSVRCSTGTLPSHDNAPATSTAAQGSDELMSQPVERTPAEPASVDHRLRRFMGDAGRCWSKLSSAELRDTNGRSHNLSLLVQDRYEISHQQADQQVREFFELRRV